MTAEAKETKKVVEKTSWRAAACRYMLEILSDGRNMAMPARSSVIMPRPLCRALNAHDQDSVAFRSRMTCKYRGPA